MKKQLTIMLYASVCGFLAFSSQASGQQKTAKACTEEWRANKAGFQAQGITQRAYVAGCRSGTPSAAAPAPSPTAPPPAPSAAGQQKTAKACTEEWRANKAGFQAQGITERAYVAGCRSGTPSAAAPAPMPPTATQTPTPAQSPATAARPAPAAVPSASDGPIASGQFSTEAQAKASCFGDTVVWVNLTSKIYHFSGYRNYGSTKNGAYMCEKQTASQGMRPAKNETHP
jgi:hypothetical protein